MFLFYLNGQDSELQYYVRILDSCKGHAKAGY
jgi:hypothetical protein